MTAALAFAVGFTVCLVVMFFARLLSESKPRMGDECHDTLLINHECGQARLPCQRGYPHSGHHAAHTQSYDVWWSRREKSN